MEKTILEVATMFEDFDFLGSRDSGEILRKRIIELLETKDWQVVVDFQRIDRVSHSFADEVFGLLYAKFGLDVIKRKIVLENAQDNIKNLANFVIKERARKNNASSRSK
ncbi:STAS-like domain-containing protein [Helicobacter kayseriensis]|uniref:STAS-like domain-containing protein n=1 Tax=Helicobacter kayseriensis TaxID=2905877 RepID=UPI001E33B1BF|nr:STAS-like domain-containing protein [Helicobacter kayseriensis]MCE3047389.1 STAS-like domain-containing protein [Helicobacter kayseriensis]MCE3048940.1 STAS-like domain-containing protein [Helicobacter kayseriensis]